jgi:septal ring factor EnvC (AmiA/AmiB activator)
MVRRLALALCLAAGAWSAQAASSAGGIEEQRRRLEALTQQEDALASKMAADRNALAKLLGALALFSRDPPPPLLVSPGDARDAVRAMILARAIAPELEARAQALGSEVAVLDRLRRRAAQASGDLFAAESAIEDRQSRLESVAEDADLMAPSAARAAASAENLAPAARFLAAPTSGPIAVRFGGRLENGQKSEGVAFRTGAGGAVRSPANAVVAYAGPLSGWGQVVILRGGGGRHMVLSGLGKASVSVGQSVAAGQVIGAMPVDGQSAPELYLEVRLARGPTDPAKLIRRGGSG